jgi:hypothetical protein
MMGFCGRDEVNVLDAGEELRWGVVLLPKKAKADDAFWRPPLFTIAHSLHLHVMLVDGNTEKSRR